MQEVITSVCAGADAVIADVFGTWDDWKWLEEQPGETSWDSLLQGRSLQCSRQISMESWTGHAFELLRPCQCPCPSHLRMASPVRSKHKQTKKNTRSSWVQSLFSHVNHKDWAGDEPETFPWSEASWEIQCHFDLDKLKEYADIGADARQDQLQQFVHVAERDGQRSQMRLTILPQAPWMNQLVRLGRVIVPAADEKYIGQYASYIYMYIHV